MESGSIVLVVVILVLVVGAVLLAAISTPIQPDIETYHCSKGNTRRTAPLAGAQPDGRSSCRYLAMSAPGAGDAGNRTRSRRIGRRCECWP